LPTAREFLGSFSEAYKKCSGIFTPERWKEIWTDTLLWNSFMLWKTARTKPKELEHSVLALTAKRLGLEYWEREPFRLDGVFYAPGASVEQNFPFPILVAIEHESDRRGFDTEISRLLSVRCPLKVGITYELSRIPRPSICEQNLSNLKLAIAGRHEEIGRVIGEDAKSEYLFLVGVEEEDLRLAWWALSFQAADGPRKSQFIRV
jgi:hypothetical protein